MKERESRKEKTNSRKVSLKSTVEKSHRRIVRVD